MSSMCSHGAIATTLVGACLWLLILYTVCVTLPIYSGTVKPPIKDTPKED